MEYFELAVLELKDVSILSNHVESTIDFQGAEQRAAEFADFFIGNRHFDIKLSHAAFMKLIHFSD